MKLNVKELAQVKGISNARELARLAGIPPSVAYNYWENRVHNYNRFTLEKIARSLDVNASMLIGEEREPSGKKPASGGKK
ncbi:MAG TPA: helix-turn-helix transcriptional regulator [Blastocatellia bacterium]